MSEEEKKLFEAIKYKNKHLFLVKVDADFLINLIENQQKEINSLKEIEKAHQEENGKLRVELEQEKEKNIFLEGFKVGAEETIKELKEKNTELRIQISAREQVCEDLQKQLNGAFDRGFILKDKIKEIVDECIEKKANVITGKEEYCFNTNDNSFLAHKIVEILEEK